MTSQCGSESRTRGIYRGRTRTKSLHLASIIKNGFDHKCRTCDQYDETEYHLFSSCPIIICYLTEYKNRHGRSGKWIHWMIYQHFKFPYQKNCYEGKLENLLLKQRVPQSSGISNYIQIEKLMPIILILQLKIIKTAHV